jgi:hypothetical protein
MAGSIAASPGVFITPSSVKATLPTNYITNFNFLNQYLPDTYEQEFERYGNRSIASFLRMVGAELPSNSDMIQCGQNKVVYIQNIQACTFAAVSVDRCSSIYFSCFSYL